MGEYRKYMEPTYGEAAPEVKIPAPEILDLENPGAWREKHDRESAAFVASEMQKCGCYETLTRVNSQEVYAELAGESVRMKIFTPPEAKEKMPVLVFYHGGSFSMNSIEVYEYVHRYLTVYGDMVVVAPDYHLAPEYKFPRGLDEAYDALLWVREHIGNYHGNPDWLCVAGDSSGGNFATVVTMLARDRKGPKIKKQILFYPLVTNYEDEMTDSEKRYGMGYFLEYNCMDDPMAAYFKEEAERKDPMASPLLCEDLKHLPEACIVAAECDPLLDQGLMYAAKLSDQGVGVEYHLMEGMIHGFINSTYDSSFMALDLAARFVGK